MTTLPPAGTPGEEPTAVPPIPEAQQPPVPPQPPVAPQAPAAPAAPQFQQPAAPQTPPAAPQFQQPAAPQQPAPQYQAPAGGQVPPNGGQGQYQQYAQPVADPVSNITLNYWLSVFFTWIPALIFFLIEKDKGNRQAYDYHRDNLNFSLTRVAATIVFYIGMVIPYLNVVLVPLVSIAMLVLFIFHIIAAVKAPEAFRTGQKPPFIFNIPFIK